MKINAMIPYCTRKYRVQKNTGSKEHLLPTMRFCDNNTGDDEDRHSLHRVSILLLFSLLVCSTALFLLLVLPQALRAQPSSAAYWLQGRNPDDAPLAAYKARRERVMKAMSGQACMALFSADERVRQNDVVYEYRQQSDLFYCTGFPEKGSALLLMPNGLVLPDSLDPSGIAHRELLFVQEASPERQLWTGAITGSMRAKPLYGIHALDYRHLRGILDMMLSKHDTVFIAELPTPQVIDPLTGDTIRLEATLPERLQHKFPGITVRSHKRLLGDARKIKDSCEIELLRTAVNITLEGHRAVMRRMRAGMYEYEAEAIMEAEFKRLGAEDVGYPSIVGAGPNSCVLHYTASRRQTQNGELLLMDCGAEYHNYTADITRTIPVSGKFSPEQRAIYDIVYAAQEAAIKEYRSNNDWRKPHSRAVEVVREGLLKLGIITNPDDYKLYFPHGSVHYIGLDVHDAGSYTVLQPNMILTSEPGIYIPENSPCDKKWWNIGIRIEDDILVTDGAPVILSAALPRTAEGIEAMMKKQRQAGKK